jgi:hypothetical protein
MAGDWIKMRTNLQDDPAVIGMASNLKIDEDSIVGKLHRLWSWADQHTTDGCVYHVSHYWIDRYVRCEGFAQAMAQEGWLRISKEKISFPNFDRHNGESAKKRAENTDRKRMSRNSRDKSVTREEKRREENESATQASPDQASPSSSDSGSLGENVPPPPAADPAPSGEADKTAPKPARKQPTGPHAEAVREYLNGWKLRYGTDYPDFGAKEGKLVKLLLSKADNDLPKLLSAIKAYLACGEPFYVNDRHGLGLLVSQWRRFVVKPKPQPVAASERKWKDG